MKYLNAAMKDKNFSTIHVINDKGDKKEVSWNELLKLNEDRNSHKYFHDVEWYLNNGYHLIDDVITEFEQKQKNGNNNQT